MQHDILSPKIHLFGIPCIGLYLFLIKNQPTIGSSPYLVGNYLIIVKPDGVQVVEAINMLNNSFRA
jgi:hypothetical protein